MRVGRNLDCQRLQAEACLLVDGKVICQMKDFSVRRGSDGKL
jgi:hypothetical protein